MRLNRFARALLVVGLAGVTSVALACGSQAAEPDAAAAAGGSAQLASLVDVKVGSKVGQRVPDFSIQLGDRSSVTSGELVGAGRPVFLYFFATW